MFNPLERVSVAELWKKEGENPRTIQKTQGAVERNDDLIKDSSDYMASSEYQSLVKQNNNVIRNPR